MINPQIPFVPFFISGQFLDGPGVIAGVILGAWVITLVGAVCVICGLLRVGPAVRRGVGVGVAQTLSVEPPQTNVGTTPLGVGILVGAVVTDGIGDGVRVEIPVGESVGVGEGVGDMARPCVIVGV